MGVASSWLDKVCIKDGGAKPNRDTKTVTLYGYNLERRKRASTLTSIIFNFDNF